MKINEWLVVGSQLSRQAKKMYQKKRKKIWQNLASRNSENSQSALESEQKICVRRKVSSVCFR